MNKKTRYTDLGKIRYDAALKEQFDYQQKLIGRKLDIRDGKVPANKSELVHNLFFCEHYPVYTLGKSGSFDNLLLNKEQLETKNIEFHKSSRGGDITYHGPGQLVGYPVFDLDDFYHDIHKYVREIEEVIILSLKEYGIDSERIKGLTGVWIKGKSGAKDRKICAIGIHISRWVTLHGFALNVNTDLDYFSGIIPCGIEDRNKDVTSIEQEKGENVNFEDVKLIVKRNFKKVFDLNYVN
jgi:lipoyl(octanoyl) transferase